MGVSLSNQEGVTALATSTADRKSLRSASSTSPGRVPERWDAGTVRPVSGQASLEDDPQLRTIASEAAMYQPEDRYVLFELLIKDARCNGYGDATLSDPRRRAASES